MNRRQFLSTAVAVPVAAALPSPFIAPRPVVPALVFPSPYFDAGTHRDAMRVLQREKNRIASHFLVDIESLGKDRSIHESD